MGMDPEAKLVYGYALGGDEDSDGWLIAEAGEYGQWEPDWIGDHGVVDAAKKRLLASVGFTETDYKVDGFFDRQREAEARLGVKFATHGGEHSCRALVTYEVSVEWGEVAVLDFAELMAARVEGDWDAKLAHALAALGVTPKQERPAWLLLAAYG